MDQARNTEVDRTTPERMESRATEEQEAPSSPAETRPQRSQPSHPVQAPYQPYPYQQQTFAPQVPVTPYSKTWHWIKIALTSTSIICCIIVLALSITLSSYAWYSNLSTTFFWATLTIVTTLWDIGEIITVYGCGRRHNQVERQGIHPGAHVGVDLIIWLSGLLGAFVSAVLYVDLQQDLSICDSYLNDSSLSTSSYGSYYCEGDEYPTLKSGFYLSAVLVILVFISILT
jgi:hypothetical protein